MVRHFALWMGVLTLCGCVTTPSTTLPDVTEAELRRTIAVLAGDEFEGRAPGTPGEEKTVAYLAQRFAAAGLANGARGPRPYLDPVPLVRVERGPDRINLRSAAGERVDLGADEAFAATRADRIAITDAALVFAGYGVDATGELLPDLRGKVVVLLGQEPHFLGPEHADRRQASRRERDLLQAGAGAVLGLTNGPGGMTGAGRSTTFADGCAGRATTSAGTSAAASWSRVCRRCWRKRGWT